MQVIDLGVKLRLRFKDLRKILGFEEREPRLGIPKRERGNEERQRADVTFFPFII